MASQWRRDCGWTQKLLSVYPFSINLVSLSLSLSLSLCLHNAHTNSWLFFPGSDRRSFRLVFTICFRRKLFLLRMRRPRDSETILFFCALQHFFRHAAFAISREKKVRYVDSIASERVNRLFSCGFLRRVSDFLRNYFDN